MDLLNQRPSVRGLVATMLWFASAAAALAEAGPCGTPGAPCEVTGGKYFVAMPQGVETPPAVIWLHGYARSGETMIQAADYVDPFTARGYAVIMPSGQSADGESPLDWGVVDGVSQPRDDVAFLRRVREDAVERFQLDPSRILLSGFSRGGSMVWDVACKAPDLANGFAAVAGAFWEPMATDCAAPVHLFHTHGFGDRLVPFEGREVVFGGLNYTQGSVMKGVDVWRHENDCMGSAQNRVLADGAIEKEWADCADGSIRLRIALADHAVPDGWRDDVIDWFEALP